MSFLFNDRFNDNKHTTHPEASSSHNSPYNDQAEYEQLLSKENGISHEKKQTIDNYDNRSPGKGLGSCGTAINTIKAKAKSVLTERVGSSNAGKSNKTENHCRSAITKLKLEILQIFNTVFLMR